MRLQFELSNETPVQAITIESLFTEYLIAKKHEVRESTLEKSREILNRHILPYLSKVKLVDLNVKKLQLWKNTIGDLDLKIKMKNNIYSEQQEFFKRCFKDFYKITKTLKVPISLCFWHFLHFIEFIKNV